MHKTHPHQVNDKAMFVLDAKKNIRISLVLGAYKHTNQTIKNVRRSKLLYNRLIHYFCLPKTPKKKKRSDQNIDIFHDKYSVCHRTQTKQQKKTGDQRKKVHIKMNTKQTLSIPKKKINTTMGSDNKSECKNNKQLLIRLTTRDNICCEQN